MNPNKPAFPSVKVEVGEAGKIVPVESYPGLTKREYFASLETLSDFDAGGGVSKQFVEQVVGRKHPGFSNAIEYLKYEAEFRAKVKLIRADALLSELERSAEK